MWILLQEPDLETRVETENILTQSQNKWGLVPGKTYKIGRVDGDISCPTDSSVSKNHAKISVVSKQSETRPEVVLEDVGSKFGTHLNDGILAESQRLAGGGGVSRALKKPRMLQDGDRIRFGVAYSIFRLVWLELEVTSSMLRDKSELNKWLSAVESGLSLKPNMSDITSHLVMSNISLSIKVVNCLAKGTPIVIPQYFRDLSTCVKSLQKLPLEDDYLPSVSNNDSESQLRAPNISFKVNIKRSKVFSDRLFIFFDNKQYSTNSPPCKLGGGDAILWSDDRKVETITVNNVVIIPPTGSRTLLWSRVTEHLSSLNVSPCHHTEIYLAIVHCSTDHFCNPAKRSKVMSDVHNTTSSVTNKKDQSILAPETCSTVSGSAEKIPMSRVAVSESLSNKSADVDTQVIVPFTGDTQIMDTSRKRQRDSSDDDKPPAKIVNVEPEQLKPPSPEPAPVSTPAECPSPPDMISAGNGKENTSHHINKQVPETNIPNDDNDEDDDDDDDLFGFGNLKIKTKKKRVLSTPDKNQSQQNGKKPRHDDEGDDDIFGFAKPDVKKEPVAPVKPIEPEKEKSPVTVEVKNKHKGNQVTGSTSSNEYYEETGASDTKVANRTHVDEKGFMGKLEIKAEVKDATTLSGDGETTLCRSVANITVTNMMRPKPSKPHYVPHPEPEKLGKPVPNFKKFKKQAFKKDKVVIEMTQYVAGNTTQSGIEEWFKNNADVSVREQEQEHMSQRTQDFWNFEATQPEKKKKNPFSRR